MFEGSNEKVSEDPVVRHRGKVRKCSINPYLKAINPLNIYNDETLKLAYSTYGLLRTPKREKVGTIHPLVLLITVVQRSSENRGLSAQGSVVRQASIFDSEYIRTKDVVEPSGATVKIVDIVSSFNHHIYPHFVSRIAKTTRLSASLFLVILIMLAQKSLH